MDRFAVFVDAGYALACCAELCVRAEGAKRSAVICSYAGLIAGLTKELQNRCGRELLRVYWYDGAINQVHTPDHLAIGQLPDVKVRLGRVVHGLQKGVDTLIVLDLTTLARERAISTAYLLSGDEDLREGVMVAQQLGVRVSLVGFEPLNRWHPNQAGTLIREADEHIVLDSATRVVPYFTAVVPQSLPAVGQVAGPEGLGETPGDAAVQVPASAPENHAPVAAPAPAEKPKQVPAGGRAYDFGAGFARAWLASNPPPTDVAAISGAKVKWPPLIPATMDAELIKRAAVALAVSLLSEQEKRELRRGFWNAIP
jgi:uncharacterized LabA/DUF88 family protein